MATIISTQIRQKFNRVRRTLEGDLMFSSAEASLFVTRAELDLMVSLADDLEKSEAHQTPQDPEDIAYSLPTLDEEQEAIL